MWLLAARPALLTKQWCLTAAMALFWPTGLVRKCVCRVRRRWLQIAATLDG